MLGTLDLLLKMFFLFFSTIIRIPTYLLLVAFIVNLSVSVDTSKHPLVSLIIKV